jgi:HEAT repeat protein
MNNQRTHFGIFGKSVTGIALAAALGLGMLAPAGTAQQRPQAEFALIYDSLDAILRDLANYKFDQGVGAPLGLRAYVFTHKDDPRARRETEAALLRFIQGSPAPGGLMAACRALRLIGGPDAVPVLAALILKPETTDAARYALERIPGGEADQALLTALDKAQGEMKRGIIFSIGERKSAAAVPAFERLAGGKDLPLAADAVMALGKFGSPEAVRALTAVLGKADPQLKLEAASALLLAAENDPGAAAIYDKLLAANLPPVMRQAAFKGKIETAGGGAKELILKTLAGKDVVLFAPAIAMISRSFKAQDIGRAADLISRLPEDSRIQLAAVLGGYPADAVGSFLLTAAEDPSVEVRLAALRAIGKAGGAKSVAFLATKAARTSGAEQEAARESLAMLRGPDVDLAILAHFGQVADDAVKAELVGAAGARRIAGGKPALMAMVKSASPLLKAKAAAALGDIAGTEDVPDLLGLLLGLEDETARESMQDTVAAVARANPRELSRAATVKAFLTGENDPKKKADLLRVLGKIGDDSSLALIRAALTDKDESVVDAAVRALADWPTGMARDDVYEVARSSFALHHRVLSLRAFVRMIGLEPFRAPDGAVADLLRALAVAPRPEEKKLVLGMLVRFPCVAGLKTAESLLADPTVAGEAKLAADRIRRALDHQTP